MVSEVQGMHPSEFMQRPCTAKVELDTALSLKSVDKAFKVGLTVTFDNTLVKWTDCTDYLCQAFDDIAV